MKKWMALLSAALLCLSLLPSGFTEDIDFSSYSDTEEYTETAAYYAALY